MTASSAPANLIGMPILRVLLVAALVLLLGASCVGGTDSTGTFLLAVDDTPIEVEAPGSLLVQLIVIGAEGREVTIEADGLPPFAALTGTQLLFEPGFDDAGDYAFGLTARSGELVSEATMRVHVTRVNTAPYWVPSMKINGELPSDSYPVVDEPVYSVVVVDDEGDAMTVELELVPTGTPSRMMATHSATEEPTLGYFVTEENPYAMGAEIEVPITGLPPGTYDLRVRVVDELGAEGPYAWYQFGGFTQP